MLPRAAARCTKRQSTTFSLGHNSRSLFSQAKPVPPRNPAVTAAYTTAFILGTGLFAVYYFDSRSALHRYIITPALRYGLDAETGHKLAVKVLQSGLGPRDPVKDDERLGFTLWDKKISNPVGMAAGFDKNGEAIDGLFNLGFSWVEIGSVTPKPQPGNPTPRVFVLPEDSALINRYGFPSQGHSAVLSRLHARAPKFLSTPPENASFRSESLLAVNLGKNKDSPQDSVDDFVAGVKRFGNDADVLVINVSSPNTPGLRGLQNRDSLVSLLGSVVAARNELSERRPKIVLKIAPDLDSEQLIDIAKVVRDHKVDGVIVSNTTIQRPKHLSHPDKTQLGGLSGEPLKPLSLSALRTLRSHLPKDIPLIGCGGISSGADAVEFAKAGASMVQIYTSFGYDGVGACRRIKDDIVSILAKEGVTWGQLVEQATEQLSLKEKAAPRPAAKESSPTVQQLIDEAQGLSELLDRLGQDMGVSLHENR